MSFFQYTQVGDISPATRCGLRFGVPGERIGVYFFVHLQWTKWGFLS
jgi:hypothetical protein